MFSEKLEARIRTIANLKENWNGYDALPITPKTILLLREVLVELLTEGFPEPEVGAVEYGGIDVDWPKKNFYSTITEEDMRIHIGRDPIDFVFENFDHAKGVIVHEIRTRIK